MKLDELKSMVPPEYAVSADLLLVFMRLIANSVNDSTPSDKDKLVTRLIDICDSSFALTSCCYDLLKAMGTNLEEVDPRFKIFEDDDL